jgi:nucleotide-binding universal stress UspA family protein
MIAHVAEAGEDRGRVVLRLGPDGAASDLAIAAALRVAAAFGAELECLHVADDRLAALAALPFVREVSLSGLDARPVEPAAIARDARLVARVVQARVEALAEAARVAVRETHVGGEPLAVLAGACAAIGPWNIVALAEPLDAGATTTLETLFERVTGATGIVALPPRAARTEGPVLVAVDDLERLAPALRTASRLAQATGGTIGIVLVNADPDVAAWMEAQARLAVGDSRVVRVEAAIVAETDTAELAAIASRRGVAFLIARLSSLTVGGGDLWPLARGLDCPLLVIR